MIPEITFKEFANNLFGYTKVHLESRGWITAKKDNLFSYCYTWGEIEDYISRWLEMVQASRLDDEVNTAFDILDKIVDAWYLLNFNHYGGRAGYNDDHKLYSQLDNEEFELLNKLRGYIHLRAKEIREAKEAKEAKGIKTVDFEDYLLCSEEQKQPLMEKLGQLYKTAEARNAFIIYKALEQLGYIATKERGKQEVYDAINKRFGKNLKNQHYQGHKKNTELFRPEIEEVGRKLKG